MRRFIAAAAVALAGSAAVAAQQEGSLAKFSSQVQLVEVYATVTDDKGELVTGLRQSDFQVYENMHRQEISTFAAGEFPLTVALGVDRSWSMAGKPLELAKQASRGFLNQLKTGDRSMVVAISSTADVIAPLSVDKSAQGRAISALDPWSTTALRDSIVAALDRLEPESGRQALVLFSDGNDPLQRRHRSGGHRSRSPQQCVDLSDHHRQTAAAVFGRARRHHRWPVVPAEGRDRARDHAFHHCAGAAVSISARLRADGSDSGRRARVEIDSRVPYRQSSRTPCSCPRRVHNGLNAHRCLTLL
jgi:hypothetical protein